MTNEKGTQLVVNPKHVMFAYAKRDIVTEKLHIHIVCVGGMTYECMANSEAQLSNLLWELGREIEKCNEQH